MVSATPYETGFFGVPDRLLEVRIRKTEISADALSLPPGMRALAAQAVELSDERRRAPETVSGDH